MHEVPSSRGYAEAIRLYGLGKECLAAQKAGLSDRALSVLTGASIQTIHEAIKVAAMYADKSAFISAFESHELPPLASYRTWGTLLMHLGIAGTTVGEAENILSSVKDGILRFVYMASSASDADIGSRMLAHIRAWVSNHVPTTQWVEDERAFVACAPCCYCGKDGEQHNLIEVESFLVPMCNTCKSEGVSPKDVDYKLVARMYSAYARECSASADIYR